MTFPVRTPRRRGLPGSLSVTNQLEALETRELPSTVSIVVDFSLDTNHFFDTPAKKSAMQAAADAYSGRFTDDLLVIEPTGSNRWLAGVNHPGTGEGINFDALVVPENTLIIYAGARSQSSGIAAIGGPGGYSPSDLRGSAAFTNAVNHRGQSGQSASPATDFGPWGGFVSFNSDIDKWYFGLSAEGIKPNEIDLYSVALHEIGHVLGFGTCDSFSALVAHDHFTGLKSTAAYDLGGNPPLRGDLAHWESGLTDEGKPTVMDPSTIVGTRVPLTDLDLAGLDDLGWTLATMPTGEKPKILLGSGSPTFARGSSPVQVDAGLQFANPDALDLNGSQLTVTISSNRNSGDKLGILALNGVKLQGKKLFFNGILVGNNLQKKGEFRIQFNSQATDQAVQSTLRNLTFATIKKSSALPRELTLQITNVAGQGSVAVRKSIQLI